MDAKRYWMGSARRLIWRHAFARWLDFFLPVGLGLSIVASAGQLALRELRVEAIWLWPAYRASLALAGVVSLLALRGHGWTRAEALGWLDEHGQLHNRLTCALEGVGAWPPPRRVEDPLRWRWRRLFYPVLLAVAVIAGSIFLPVAEVNARETPHDQPLAWSQMQTWAEQMKEAKLPDPQALEKLVSQLGELRQQSPDQWYSQSSLEAGDSLRRQTEQSLQGMQDELRRASEVVDGMSKLGANTTPESLSKMRENLGAALQGLQMGNLPLNREMLKELKDLQPGEANLSQGQLEQLRQRLQLGEQVCGECLKPHGTTPSDHEAQSGGKGGGGDTAPLGLKDEPTDLNSKQTEGLASEDYSRALPADLAGISAGAHDVKKEEAAGPVPGGEIRSLGGGGAEAWKSEVLPRERAVLQRFFK